MSTKGKTRWFPRHTPPVRHGLYECVARICPGVCANVGLLKWDGIGFEVAYPMRVLKWRGITRRAAKAGASVIMHRRPQ